MQKIDEPQIVTIVVPADLVESGVRVFMREALEAAITMDTALLVLDLDGWDAPQWFVEACEKMVVVLAEIDCDLQVDGIQLADLPVVVGVKG